MSHKVYKTGEVIVKHLIACNPRMTTREIFDKYHGTYPELRSLHHLKRNILRPLWERGDVFKKIDHELINPSTKRATWFWYINEELKQVYEKSSAESTDGFTKEPELWLKKENIIPLLGRTGPYSKFEKEGIFEEVSVQRK